MKALRLLGLVTAAGFTWAQSTPQPAHCSQDQQFSWMFNSRRQDPCEVAQYLGGVCNNGEFLIPALSTDQVYIGPSVSAANECRCSSVFYSLLSACALCQLAHAALWDTYDGNCSTAYVGVFPGQIPSDTAVPHWAYMNVTQFGGFNATYAQQLSDSPESTAGSQATSNPSPSSHKSSIAGPVAGGVVGGVVFVALVAVVVLLLLRQRRKSLSVQNPHNVAALRPGEFLPDSKPPLNYQPYAVPMSGQAPLFYDPSDARTFPDPVQSPLTTGGTATVNVTGGMSMKPAITGSSFSSGPRYTGIPEI